MKLILLLFGMSVAITLINKFKWAGFGLTLFWFFEITFRDFGLLRLLINGFWGQFMFLVATIFLCVSTIRIINVIGDDK